MFKTVEEGLAKYKALLREYLERSAATKKKYGHSDWMAYDDDDYTFLIVVNCDLTAMAESLGLSEKEEKEIMEEIKRSLTNKT